MKAANLVSTVLTIVVVMPIWFYLLYTLLKGVNASELTWFLFWVYIPVAALCRVIAAIVGNVKLEGEKR